MPSDYLFCICCSYYYAGSTRIAMRVQQAGVQDVVSYLHGDHLGSASLTTDASGAEKPGSRTGYYPYGATRYGGTGLPTDYRFTGQRSEEASLGSLYDFGARFYSPVLARFLSADTIVPQAGNPQALNRYSYVNNNPLKYIDPSGHCWGFASGLRGTGAYGATCNNMDMALTIVQSPKTSLGEKAFAGWYLGTEGTMHAAVAVGTAYVGWAGASAAGAALSGSATATGAAGTAGTAATAACADGDCTNEVQAVEQSAQQGANVLSQAADKIGQAGEVVQRSTYEVIHPATRLQRGVTALGPSKDVEWVSKNLPGVRTLVNTTGWQWKLNVKWLDAAIRRGDEIWLLRDPDTVKYAQWYMKEVEYLKSVGYGNIVKWYGGQ